MGEGKNRAFPFKKVKTKKLLQVFAIFLNVFSILEGRSILRLAQTARCWLVLEFRTPTRIQFARATSFFNASLKTRKKIVFGRKGLPLPGAKRGYDLYSSKKNPCRFRFSLKCESIFSLTAIFPP